MTHGYLFCNNLLKVENKSQHTPLYWFLPTSSLQAEVLVAHSLFLQVITDRFSQVFYCCLISLLFQPPVSVTSLLLHDRHISVHVLNAIMIASHLMTLLTSFLTIILIDKPSTIGICLNLGSSESRSHHGPECRQFIWKVILGSKNETIKRQRETRKNENTIWNVLSSHCCGLSSTRIVYRMPPITIFLKGGDQSIYWSSPVPIGWGLPLGILILLLFHDAFSCMQAK